MISFFNSKPSNYERIDSVVSRSAQPNKRNINWLKKDGVTDVINLRHGDTKGERQILKEKGMNYHNIPLSGDDPCEVKVGRFLDIIDDVRGKGGKVHIHDRNGSVRSKLVAFIYRERTYSSEIAKQQSQVVVPKRPQNYDSVSNIFKRIGKLFFKK